MENLLLDIIYKSQLPDNNVRSQAERGFFAAISENPSAVASALINISLNQQSDLIVKQSALVYLKRVVALHWSIGFESFAGNPVTQETKVFIRSSLLRLVSETENTKLRNAASNIIVMISVVDYPDEWPDLIKILYSLIDNSSSNVTQNSLLGGLNVLHDLFDELITEEQFFEGFVGANTLKYCIELLAAPSAPIIGSDNYSFVPLVIKNQVAKLFEVVLKQIQGPEVFSNPSRAALAAEFLPKCLELILNLVKEQFNYVTEILNTNINILNIENVLFTHKLYDILTFMIDSYKRKLFNDQSRAMIQELVVNHIANLSRFYYNISIASEAEANPEKFIVHTKKDEADFVDPSTALNNLVTQIIQIMGSLSDCLLVNNPSSLRSLLNSFVIFNTVPIETYELYIDNFNLFVTDETEMSGLFTVRNSVSDYLSEVQSEDAAAFLEASLMLLSDQSVSGNWRNKESLLSMLESLFLNEDDNTTLPGNISFEAVLESLLSHSSNSNENPMVIARSVLVLAKYLEKFGQNVSNFNELSYKALTSNLSTAANIKNSDVIKADGIANDANFDKESNDCIKIIQSAALISLTYFNSFLKFDDKSLNVQIQHVIHQIMHFLVDEAEEDTPAVLLESLTISINIDLKSSQAGTDDITLIFKIAGVDFSNIMNVQTAKDSLETLLTDIAEEDYLKQCEFGLPSLIEILNESKATGDNIEFSPKLYMALELLNIFIDNRPSERDLPESLFNFIFAPLTGLLIHSVDDQILQIGGEVFNTVLVNANERYFLDFKSNANKNGIQIALQILEKFLSPTLSDSAAMSVGSIVVSIVQKFKYQLNDYMPKILESATRRLLIANHPIIIENLMTVFCYLVLLSPEETLNFLGSLSFPFFEPPTPGAATYDNLPVEKKNGIEVVLPIWLDSFTSTGGAEKIKQNVNALGKIFLAKDSRVENLIVKGDLIPNQNNPDIIITRSMAKKMPMNFTQISASTKILKLFLQELSFLSQQPDTNDYVTTTEEVAAGGDEDEWEDVGDIGIPTFNKLKSFVEDDEKNTSLDDESSQDLKIIITSFLKECIQSGGDFQKFYEQLNDNEKKTIATTMC